MLSGACSNVPGVSNYSPETRRLLRERHAWLLERARWGFAVSREDDADCSAIEGWAREQLAEAARVGTLLGR